MPLPETSDIVNALIATLRADATLMALVPHGVWYDGEAPANATRFVIVSLADPRDIATLGKGRAIEDGLYMVEARMRSTVTGDIDAAASRIEALLEDQPFLVTGYTWMCCHRESPIRATERDAIDTSILFRRRGGKFRVQMFVN